MLLNNYDTELHDGSYYFDPIAAERPLLFAEKYLTHTIGNLAGKRLVLIDDHKDYIRALFGYKHKQTKLRRYRTTLYSAGRGNAKTTLSSLIALYMTFCCDVGGAQTYLCASTRDQAGINFDIIKQQIYNNNQLRGRLEVLESRKRVLYRKNNSFLSATSRDATSAAGWNTTCCIADEVGKWRGQQGRDFWGQIETSFVKQQEPLLYISSTQTYERTGIWYDLYSYAKRCKTNPHIDPTFLPLIYELDANDDWTNLEHIKKANPLWGKGVQPEYIDRMLKKAQEVLSFENEFKREHCNMLVEQSNRFIKMEDWYACPTEEIEITNKDVIVGGLDTSSTSDLTCLSLYCRAKNWLRCWFFIPGDNARQRSMLDGVDYLVWQKNPNSNLIFSNSKRIDRQVILNKILELNKTYRISAIAYDPYEGKVGLVDDLHKKGIKCVEYLQGYAHMNAPTKELEMLIATHKLNKGNNPCLDWNFSNLCVKELNGLVRPVKGDEHAKRVDGCIASIIAIGISKSINSVNII